MKITDLRTFAEVVGIAAIVVSLLFLGYQLKQTHQIAVSEINASHHSSSIEVKKSISEYAEIWFKGNGGQTLDQSEMIVYQNLVGMLATQYSAEHGYDQLFGNAGSTEARRFAIFLHRNPGARQVWTQNAKDNFEYLQRLNPEADIRSWNQLVTEDLVKLDEAAQ